MNHHLNLHYAAEAGRTKTLGRLRFALILFILLLALSGITAFPLVAEIDFLFEHKEWFPGFLMQWIAELYRAIHKTPTPMLYGTDWLAFGHIVISLFFIPAGFYLRTAAEYPLLPPADRLFVWAVWLLTPALYP
jgi:hypothetical protein